MISRASFVAIGSFFAIAATVTGCAVDAGSQEEEGSVASAAGKRKGGGGSPEWTDAGVPLPPPLPPTLVRGDYALPLSAEPAYVEPQELDCYSENPIWNRLAFFPVTTSELDRLGLLQIRYYSMSLGLQGIEDQGGGIGNIFRPLAGAPVTLSHAAGGELQKLDFTGEALEGNPKPYHVAIERVGGSLVGQYEYASVIQPEKVTPITSCAPKSISHMNAEMAFNVIGLTMATGVACNVTSGARAGSNVMIHPMVGADVVRIGGTYLSYYQGELDGGWNEQKRGVESVLYRPSRDVTSKTLSYTPAMGVSPAFDFHGVSETGDDLRIQATKASAAGYDWSATLGDGTTIQNCRWIISPSAIRKFEAERLVHVGLPRATVTIVAQ